MKIYSLVTNSVHITFMDVYFNLRIVVLSLKPALESFLRPGSSQNMSSKLGFDRQRMPESHEVISSGQLL